MLKLRYAGTCRLCQSALPAGTRAVYEPSSKTVRCIDCREDQQLSDPAPASVLAEVVTGTAGSSARREHERRVTRRETRIREAHPRIGGLLLAVTSEPTSTTAWAVGADGEERLGARLDRAADETLRVLHDRRIPGSRANIDHIMIARSGVYVVDAKNYKDRPERRVEGGLLRPRVDRLMVGSRDRSALVDGMEMQLNVVRQLLPEPDEVSVHGALCFVNADWPLIGGSFAIRGIHVVWPKKLVQVLQAEGALTCDGIERTAEALAGRLSAA